MLRAQVMIGPNEDIATDRFIDRETYEVYLKRMVPYKHKIMDARYMSRYRLHRRCADAYRSGRAFLAGDAAHVHSPVGAQGMNTSIQARSVGVRAALQSLALRQHVCVERVASDAGPVQAAGATGAVQNFEECVVHVTAHTLLMHSYSGADVLHSMRAGCLQPGLEAGDGDKGGGTRMGARHI